MSTNIVTVPDIAPKEDVPRLAQELDLARRLHNLGRDQRECLFDLVTKAEAGMRKYGELVLDTDPRDFSHEQNLELLDALWYAQHEIIRLKRRIADLEANADSQWRALRREAEASVAAAPVMISDLRDEVTP